MKLYFARNKEGKFLKGVENRDKYEYCWMDDMEDARYYHKPGPMKQMLTRCYNKWPEQGCPDLLEFDLNTIVPNVINYTEVAKKSKIRKEKLELKRKERDLEYEKEKLQREILEAQRKLQELK